MGPSDSKAKQSIDLSLNHPRFTNAKFITDEKGRRMQTVMGVDNKAYDKWKTVIKNQPFSRYLLLPVHHQFASKGLCGSSGTLTLDYEDYPYLLTEQMSNRKGKRKLFQQNQIWYLLFALISAKKSLNPPFSKLGDVRPTNVFINDKGDIQVANLYSWPNQQTNFVKTLESQVTYISPQQLKQVENGSPQSDKNGESELFSIGLTLLSAVTLQDFSNSYDVKKFLLNNSKISEKINEFKVNRAYSDILKGVVCNLCEFDPSRRVTSEQLWNWVSPHQQKILSRQNFFFPSAPEKIHNQVVEIRQMIAQLYGKQTHTNPNLPFQPLSNQRLNFPPPIVRNSNMGQLKQVGTTNGVLGILGRPTSTGGTNSIGNNVNQPNASLVSPYTGQGFTNISTAVWNAQSVYIPANRLNQNEQVSSNNNTSLKTTAQFGAPSTSKTPDSTQAQQQTTKTIGDQKSGQKNEFEKK